jgi:hypothetical protein
LLQLVVRAFPVLPGLEDRARQLAREAQTTRSSAARDFYRRHGVARESWHAQATPHGLLLVVVSQIAGQPVELAAKGYGASQEPFDRWLKDQVKHLTGIDLDLTPLGPATECIFDSSECPPPAKAAKASSSR